MCLTGLVALGGWATLDERPVSSTRGKMLLWRGRLSRWFITKFSTINVSAYVFKFLKMQKWLWSCKGSHRREAACAWLARRTLQRRLLLISLKLALTEDYWFWSPMSKISSHHALKCLLNICKTGSRTPYPQWQAKSRLSHPFDYLSFSVQHLLVWFCCFTVHFHDPMYLFAN